MSTGTGYFKLVNAMNNGKPVIDPATRRPKFIRVEMTQEEVDQFEKERADRVSAQQPTKGV